jgi:hypothetical protein
METIKGVLDRLQLKYLEGIEKSVLKVKKKTEVGHTCFPLFSVNSIITFFLLAGVPH